MPPKKRKPTKSAKNSKPKVKARSKSRRGRPKKVNTSQMVITPKVLSSIAALIFYLLAILIILGFFTQGELISALARLISLNFGWGKLLLPLIAFFAGNILLNPEKKLARPTFLLGAVIFFVSAISITQAGHLGRQFWSSLAILMSKIGAFLIYLTGILIGFMVFFDFTLKDFISFFSRSAKPKQLTLKEDKKLKDKTETSEEEKPKVKFSLFGHKSKKETSSEADDDINFKIKNLISETKNEKETDDWDDKPLVSSVVVPAPTIATPSVFDQDQAWITQVDQIPVWQFPPLSLLSSAKGAKADRGDIKKNADIIEETLGSFGINAKVEEVSPGPTVTQYAIKPSIGTKLSKITTLSNDLAMALSAKTGQIRIEAPIPGKPLVGIEVPNNISSLVSLRDMLSDSAMQKDPSKLLVSLGLDVSGAKQFLDITKMPHLLIAGQTGSGKSVCINGILASVLFRAAPHEVKLILVDPKRVELTIYNNIPHLLTPVIVEADKVLSSLKWAVAEMDKRYKLLAEAGCRNIGAYNEMMGFISMPYIMIVIDELADVMLFAPSEVEDCINRIAQMARAVGIHLVLATQRPSVDIITGLIKANIPARIAFSVSSMMDSRVILDSPGAEKLLGRGDMLFIPPDQAKPRRLQGAFVTDEDIRNLTDFLKNNGLSTQYSQDITHQYEGVATKGGRPVEQGELGDVDDLFKESVRVICQYDRASASLLQRALSIGYNRAARILDELHERGAISAPNGSKPREVLVRNAEAFLAELAQKKK